MVQAEVLDRQRFASLADAEAALAGFVQYYNYRGVLGWVTPAGRYDGTPFTDRGFEHIPALTHLQPWLMAVMSAA